LVIERGLTQFIAVGTALLELRSRRLYRETHSSFESFCRDTFALARSTVDQVICSATTAQLLIDNGVQLPANTTEAVIRPLASLPSPELQTASWKLIQSVSPACGPTQPIAAKVCRTIKNALEPNGTGGNGHKPRKREHPSREQPFLPVVQRLAKYEGFNVAAVIGDIEKLPRAWNIHTACFTLIQRCEAVMNALEHRFPELTHG
jgi:hypothetical protein